MAPHRNCVAGIPMNGFVRSRNKIPDELAKLSLRDLKWKLKQELAGTAAYGKARVGGRSASFSSSVKSKNRKSESMKKQAHNISNLNSGKQQPRPDNNNNILVEEDNNNTLKSYSSRGLRHKVRGRETPESCIRLQVANYLSRKDNVKKFASQFIGF